MTDHMQVLRDDIRAHELTENGGMDRVYAMRWAVAEIGRLRAALTTCVNHADEVKVVVRTAVNALSHQEAD